MSTQQSLSRRRFSGLAAVFSIAILVLAACGNSTKSSSNAVLTMAPSPTGSFSENFNPFLTNGNANLYGTDGMLYETLFFFNRIDGKVTPMLGTQFQTKSDATGVTVTLRQGVKWSDGQPFTSKDVVFTYNELQQFPAFDTAGLWSVLSTVSATDDFTVNFTFKQPSSSILWNLIGQTYIVPQHIWQSISDPVKFTNTSPVGTGPFVLKSFSSQIYKLSRNASYWQPGLPKVQEIDYPAFTSNSTAELALEQGSLDWDGQYLANIQTSFVNRNASHNHYWFPPHQVTMLYMNLTKFPFNILAVRQAMSIAIDRDQLNTIGESGYQGPANPTGLILPNNQSYLASTYSSLSYSVDTSKAESLLQSAGFTKDSKGIYANSRGQELSFNLDVVTGWSDWDTDSQLIQSELQKIGINVNVNATAFGAYFSAMQTGSFDMAISWTNPGPTPYYLYNSLLNSQFTAPVGQTAASNWDRWSDPATDQYLNQYNTSTDPIVQTQAIQGLEQVMVTQIPAIPLIYGSTWYEYSTSRFAGWPDQSNQYAVPGPYEAPDAEIVVLHLNPTH